MKPFDFAQDKPFDFAQDKPFDFAQDKPFDFAQDKPFDFAQGKPFDFAQGKQFNNVRGFSLFEVLIAVAILATITAFLFSSNVLTAVKKGRDTRRKADLHKLASLFEDYYNDNQRYPPVDISSGTILNSPWGSSFLPYISTLPKDPSSPERNYYYQTDENSRGYFLLFAKLEYVQDPEIEKSGCLGGCGPNNEYNYVVKSPNAVLGLSTDTSNPPPGSGCNLNQCGPCSSCGGKGGTNCGSLTRCVKEETWKCKFDIGCIY